MVYRIFLLHSIFGGFRDHFVLQRTDFCIGVFCYHGKFVGKRVRFVRKAQWYSRDQDCPWRIRNT